MIGRGIGIAGIWLGVGLALGLGAGQLAGWGQRWLLICALIVSAPLIGPWTWTKD